MTISGILVRFADVSPSTAATFRAFYALPILLVYAAVEARHLGQRPWAARRWAFLAGLFFAADLTFFHHAIELVGAGLATVLGNLQVLFVGVVAWLLLGERPNRALLSGVPIALVGVLLISGILGGGAYGRDPVLGAVVGLLTAASYAAYLLLIRKGRDTRRIAGTILDATAACAVGSAVGGLLVGDLDLLPSWPGHGWLVVLALSAQVGGGLLIAIALPRMAAVTTSVLLLTQPVMSVVMAMILVAETPSAFQLVGVLLVVLGVAVSTIRRDLLATGARRVMVAARRGP